MPSQANFIEFQPATSRGIADEVRGHPCKAPDTLAKSGSFCIDAAER